MRAAGDYRDTLEGELTLSFSILARDAIPIQVGHIAEYEGDYFNIVRVAKSISNGIMTAAITTEHISYVLNDERYELEGFTFSGTPSAGLALLLSGTQFSPGTVDFTDPVEMAISTKVTRRKALMQFIAILGGEIEYDGTTISIRAHRGSTTRRNLMDSKNIRDVSATYDSRAMIASFELSFYRTADFSVGDEVAVVFRPLALDSEARIVSMEYSPFYRHDVRVEVGDYVPEIDHSIAGTSEEVDNRLTDLETEMDGLLGMFKEVTNIRVGETQFTVTFADDSTAVYNYTVDSDGRMTGITRVVE